jgi:23S rRNA (pseudouridine1915-N3)-methyltransferase
LKGGIRVKIRIICVGKVKEDYIRQGIADYLGRLKHYTEVEYIELKDEKILSPLSEELIKKREAQRIEKTFLPDGVVIILDERGQSFSSKMLAEFLQHQQMQGTRAVEFVIGGTLGLADSILKKAFKVLSLSRMTFTHQLCRLILLEQLYRAFTILKGEPYHKD